MEKPLSQADELKVIIAGGGTGGHVFPAIAIALALKKKVYNAKILFVGAKGRMEMKKVPAAGFHIIGLNISGIQRRLTWKNLQVPFKLLDSLVRARNIVKRFKPDVVIGVGGYASGPIVRAAAKQGIPTLIQEQNSFPGLTNRILGKKADKICVAYEGMERFFEKSKLYLTGNPVRQDIVSLEGKYEEAMTFFGFSATQPVLFVTGGSLGAYSINESIAHNLQFFMEKGIQLIWQTGTHFYQNALGLVKGYENQVYVKPFIDRMDFAYAASDVVISRAGAIAVSEICTVQKPAILIPSPNVAEDHQTKNALALVNHHAAVLVRDAEVKEKLGPVVFDLIQDEEKRFRLKEKLVGLSFRDAADVIAGVALSLVKNK
ncbi:MAG: undecaprenyldiphospho-muramoylpentapeptide beta-N-acetylglucosaminyltransferase [Bacteroides sp.]|jgi:UDP-N-acetylglucosamine--N-acetylmuramyl-(pentapeptide) pyrophosphoryl-undecaprenol N-acetylglucosamine transferase|nr:undecaprenyldiphospho-muramoylpentapeptide beta-N-acetylglucosaminyltransferase [Bacteroides sp.]